MRCLCFKLYKNIWKRYIRKSREDRQKNEKEVHLLKEKNEALRRQLNKSPHGQQFPSSEHTQSPEKTVTVQTQTQYASRPHTKRTHVIEDDNEPKGHPFTNEVMDAQLSPKWKSLNIELYDGSTNLDEDINVYKTQMNLYTTKKAVWCKVFPTSLKEGTLSWYTQHPFDLVDSFKTLSVKFSTRFASSQPHHISSLALFNVRQEKGEPLRAFMKRFNKLSLSIRILMLEIAMHHSMSTL